MNISKKEMDTALDDNKASIYCGGVAGILPKVVAFDDGRLCFRDDGAVIHQVVASDDWQLKQALDAWDYDEHGVPVIIGAKDDGGFNLSTINMIDYGLVDSRYYLYTDHLSPEERLQIAVDTAIAEAIESIQGRAGLFNGERTYNGHGTCTVICDIVSTGKNAMQHNHPHNATRHFLAAALLSKYGHPLNCSDDMKGEICTRLKEAQKLAEEHTDASIWAKAIQEGMTPMKATTPFQKLVVTHHDGTETHHWWQEVIDWVRNNKPRALDHGYSVPDCFIEHKLGCANGAREYSVTNG